MALLLQRITEEGLFSASARAASLLTGSEACKDDSQIWAWNKVDNNTYLKTFPPLSSD